MTAFNLGDRVEIITRYGNLSIGLQGVVAHIHIDRDSELWIGVDFGHVHYYTGSTSRVTHDLMGHIEIQSGYYLPEYCLVLINSLEILGDDDSDCV